MPSEMFASWTISYPSQWLQIDGKNCRVFVCTVAELEVRGTEMNTETPNYTMLGYPRSYHAASLAITLAVLRHCGIGGLITDHNIEETKGSSRVIQMSKLKRFRPAVAQHCEELVEKMDKIATASRQGL